MINIHREGKREGKKRNSQLEKGKRDIDRETEREIKKREINR